MNSLLTIALPITIGIIIGAILILLIKVKSLIKRITKTERDIEFIADNEFQELANEIKQQNYRDREEDAKDHKIKDDHGNTVGYKGGKID